MKHLFYFMLFIPIVWEMMNVASPVRMHKKLTAMKDRKWEGFSYNQKFVSVFMLFYMAWAFIGLFSFQWWAFAGLLALSVLVPKKWMVTRWIDSLISLALLIFIVVNAYHLQIDLF